MLVNITLTFESKGNQMILTKNDVNEFFDKDKLMCGYAINTMNINDVKFFKTEKQVSLINISKKFIKRNNLDWKFKTKRVDNGMIELKRIA